MHTKKATGYVWKKQRPCRLNRTPPAGKLWMAIGARSHVRSFFFFFFFHWWFMLCLVYTSYLVLVLVSEIRTSPFWLSSTDGGRMQPPKRYLLNKKTGRWVISKNWVISRKLYWKISLRLSTSKLRNFNSCWCCTTHLLYSDKQWLFVFPNVFVFVVAHHVY